MQCGRFSKRDQPLVRKDCSKLGPTYINDPDNVTECILCKNGLLANEARDSCIGKAGSDSFQNIPLKKKDCSTAGPGFINNPENEAKCIRCPGNKVANEARDDCVFKAKLVRPETDGSVSVRKRRGDTWLNPQPEPPSPVRRCPPNMKPNVGGTGCVPTLDMPDFGTPGSAVPGGAPPMPSFRRH
jgi:hypothetical protein